MRLLVGRCLTVAARESAATFSGLTERSAAARISSNFSVFLLRTEASSSSSAVMDLERRVNVVLGALFGGGGAFFLIPSSSSGFRLTVTTFISRLFPPCRIMETTCLCPTFTTLMLLTSIRKSPVLSPAFHATPSTSTDSRYCKAGNAGVGVNSSIGVSAS